MQSFVVANCEISVYVYVSRETERDIAEYHQQKRIPFAINLSDFFLHLTRDKHNIHRIQIKKIVVFEVTHIAWINFVRVSTFFFLLLDYVCCCISFIYFAYNRIVVLFSLRLWNWEICERSLSLVAILAGSRTILGVKPTYSQWKWR